MPYTIRFPCARCGGRCVVARELAEALARYPAARRLPLLGRLTHPFVCIACNRSWDLADVTRPRS